MKRLLFLVSLCFLAFSAKSQSFVKSAGSSPLELTVGLGTATYYGDLVSNSPYNNVGTNINLGARYRVMPHVKLGLDASLIDLSGKDTHEVRGLSFNSINYEIAGLVQLELFDNISKKRSKYRQWVIPYVFAGVGGLFFNPTTTVDGTKYDLRDYQTNGEEYDRMAWVVPMGVGVKFEINPQITVGLQVSYRATFTDYLDDVSKEEYRSLASFDNLSNEEKGIAMLLAYGSRYEMFTENGFESKHPRNEEITGYRRGNPDKDDAYSVTSIRLTYNMSKGTFKKRSSRKGMRYKAPKRRKPRMRRRR